MERVPYQVTSAAGLYQGIGELPVTVLLDDIRSLYNVGAFFRSADAVSIQKLILCGITGRPPHKGISKTAQGADETVPWEGQDAVTAIGSLRAAGYELAVIETSTHAVDLFDWRPQFPVCVVFGNEVDGVRPEVAALCDTHVRIPMLGLKHSLHVATAGGVVLYELLRKYRALRNGTAL